jgi:Peptidase family M48
VSRQLVVSLLICLIATGCLAGLGSGLGSLPSPSVTRAPASALPAGPADDEEPITVPDASKTAPDPGASDAGDPKKTTKDGKASRDGDETADGEEKKDEKKKEDEDKRPPRIILDTEYDDRRVGDEQTEAVRAEMGLVEDPELNRYVQSVATRLLRYAPPRPFEYEFGIVDQVVPNAFALPGGKIYVSRGLLALVGSEDELAGVLGHEITHAAERSGLVGWVARKKGRRDQPIS